jgi:thiamine biosynthesis lipoprotein ApbE
MNTFGRNMNRRSFLKLPALLPFSAFNSAFHSEEHHFPYECVIGTSLDLVVWTPNSSLADHACRAVLREIDRLASILDTRDPSSEISLLGDSNSPDAHELTEVLAAYDYWERRTGGVFSIRPGGANTPRNVDALGKAYIIDRAVKAARNAAAIDALLLNIGGDIVVWGRSCEIAIADPGSWYDNAEPIARINLRNAAVATSGAYARGAHLSDAQNGQPIKNSTAATVVAPDAVTANALATSLCLTSADYGFELVESTPGAEALRVATSGILQRTSGFARLERSLLVQTAASANWPPDYHLTMTLTLTKGRSKKRPYVAVWVEDSSGKLVRILAFWGRESKYFWDLSTIWDLVGRNQKRLQSVTRATRPPGKYELVWDGLDEEGKPTPLGTYRIMVETNQEHGTYAKQGGTISIGDSPASITLSATTNFDAVSIQYGPKQNRP